MLAAIRLGGVLAGPPDPVPSMLDRLRTAVRGRTPEAQDPRTLADRTAAFEAAILTALGAAALGDWRAVRSR